MLASYVTAVVALVAVVLAWVGIQIAWRRVFPAVGCDPDALAGRMGCHGCQEQDAEELKEKAECPRRECR
jgi:hypothetical protein